MKETRKIIAYNQCKLQSRFYMSVLFSVCGSKFSF